MPGSPLHTSPNMRGLLIALQLLFVVQAMKRTILEVNNPIVQYHAKRPRWEEDMQLDTRSPSGENISMNFSPPADTSLRGLFI